jgi:hypothetical protein
VSFRTWLLGYPKHSPSTERTELLQLQAEVRQHVSGTLLERSPDDIVTAITKTIFEDAGCDTPSAAIEQRVREVVKALFRDEWLFQVSDFEGVHLNLGEAVAVRNHLRKQRLFLQRSDSAIGAWRDTVARMLVPIIEALPAAVAQGTEPTPDGLQAPLIALLHSPATLIERAYYAPFGGDADIQEFGLFSSLKYRLHSNLEIASGIVSGRSSTKPLVYPTNAEGKSPTELVEAYFGDTPIAELLLTPIPFEVPFPYPVRAHPHRRRHRPRQDTAPAADDLPRPPQGRRGQGLGRRDRQPGRPYPDDFAPGALRSRPAGELG